jgi:glyoxylase-like metal-dependent hydrolase (beta-lactamase superfamily II)
MRRQVLPGLTRIGAITANAYLLDVGADRLVLVDTGFAWPHPGMIRRAIRDTGHQPSDVGDILVTHQHADHAGGLRRLAADTGARVHVHALDAPEIEQGLPARPGRPPLRVGPVPVDHPLVDGQTAAGLDVIHTPGHTAGHCAFLWDAHAGVLLAGDAAANWFGRLGKPPVAEDWDQAYASVGILGGHEFEVAVFGHGRVIRGGASDRIRAFAATLPTGPAQ